MINCTFSNLSSSVICECMKVWSIFAKYFQNHSPPLTSIGDEKANCFYFDYCVNIAKLDSMKKALTFFLFIRFEIDYFYSHSEGYWADMPEIDFHKV